MNPKPQPVRGDDTCKHDRLVEVTTDFGRIENREGPDTFAADIRIKCADCGVPFRFKGLPGGSSPSKPMVSINGEELRAPMEPAYVEALVIG